MKRSELHAKIWASPMTRVAKELGISDVGLAKACRRHAVPAPPRGYWAKKAAGQKMPVTPMPAPELDTEVDFRTTDPAELERVSLRRAAEVKVALERSEKLNGMPALVIESQLVRPHTLVAATRRFVDDIPRIKKRFDSRGSNDWRSAKFEYPPREHNARYELTRKDQLAVTASLVHIDWILRFHDTFIKAIEARGFKVAYKDSGSDRDQKSRVEATLAGEVMTFSFSEGYRRVRIEEPALSKLKKEKSWASEWQYEPSEKFTLRVVGDVSGASREWTGLKEKMEASLTDIVQTFVDLVPKQKELRQAYAERQRVEQERARAAAHVHAQQQARQAQLKKAFEMAETFKRVEILEEFLHKVDSRVGTMSDERAQCTHVWLNVVREELNALVDIDSFLTATFKRPLWGSWPPDWWPDDIEIPCDEASP